jgi:hypothetical protein
MAESAALLVDDVLPHQTVHQWELSFPFPLRFTGQLPELMGQSVRAGQVKIIACIEDPAVIERILAHLKGKAPSAELAMLPEGRAPPQARLFD